METPAAAPAGNAAATPSATPNGAQGQQTPVPPAKPKPNAGQAPVAAKPDRQEAKPGPAKGPDGKFVSPDSGTARKPAESEPGAEEKKEAYRFKRKLKDGDQEYEVDLDEDALAREVSISRAAKRRLGELNKRFEAARQEEELAKKDPMAALEAMAQRLGVDPDELATKRLAARATRQLMSPEEQQIAEKDQELESLRAWKKEQEQREVQARQAAHEEKMWAQEEPLYLQAMEKAKLPRDPSVLGLLAKVGQEFTQAFGKEFRPPPEAVVAETNERLGKMADHYVLSLSPEALAAKLGEGRLKALLQWKLDKWRAAQSSMEPVPQREEPLPPPAEPAERVYLSEADIRRRQRELWNK